MNRILYTMGSCIFLANIAFAADIPSVDQGAQKYDRQTCIQTYSENCINTACLNSDKTDCEDNCRMVAKAKCEQEIQE
jgi:hypothetical protein